MLISTARTDGSTAAVNTGELTIRTDGGLGVPWGVRGVVPLIEIRVPFELPLMAARQRFARRGARSSSGGQCCGEGRDKLKIPRSSMGSRLPGLRASSQYARIRRLRSRNDFADYPSIVWTAAETLRRAGINGPYALALGPACYAGLAQAAEDGYPIRERVEHFLDGPMVRARAIDGALLLSHRGGDYRLSVGTGSVSRIRGSGQGHRLPLPDESFAFRVLD